MMKLSETRRSALRINRPSARWAQALRRTRMPSLSSRKELDPGGFKRPADRFERT
jgi:hypothetical protein